MQMFMSGNHYDNEGEFLGHGIQYRFGTYIVLSIMVIYVLHINIFLPWLDTFI